MCATSKTGEAAAQRCFLQVGGSDYAENGVSGVMLGSNSAKELSKAHGNTLEYQILSVNFGLDIEEMQKVNSAPGWKFALEVLPMWFDELLGRNQTFLHHTKKLTFNFNFHLLIFLKSCSIRALRKPSGQASKKKTELLARKGSLR